MGSLTPAWSHTSVEIDHEIISTVILLPSAESFKNCTQLQAKLCAWNTGSSLPRKTGKKVVRWTDRPAMTIAVDLGRKATKQTIKTNSQGLATLMHEKISLIPILWVNLNFFFFKCEINKGSYIFFHALTFARCWGSCLKTMLLGWVFKHLPSDRQVLIQWNKHLWSLFLHILQDSNQYRFEKKTKKNVKPCNTLFLTLDLLYKMASACKFLYFVTS